MGEGAAWRPFLARWSEEWIAGHDPAADGPLAPEVVRDTWLGYEPASEAQVVAAEDRLGCRPPSLREFLLRPADGDARRALTDLVWHVPVDGDVLRGPLFTAELLPLLRRHDRLATGHEPRPLRRLREQGPAELVATYEARAAEPGFRLTFGGGGDFDAAVRAIADRLAAHPAFRARAEPSTGPLVATGYANGPAPDPGRVRAALCAAAWTELRAAVRLWRPVCADHIAPISLFADPVLAELVTPDRGRDILATARGHATT